MDNTLDILIVPFEKEQAIIFPKQLVEYILPYAPPLPIDYVNPALVGSLIYKNEKVPVMNINGLHSKTIKNIPQLDGKHRIVIVSCTSRDSLVSSYAIIGSDAPRILRITEDSMKEIKTDLPYYFYSEVNIGENSEPCRFFVPNLTKIENEILSDLTELKQQNKEKE